jgi:hypothetical protein
MLKSVTVKNNLHHTIHSGKLCHSHAIVYHGLKYVHMCLAVVLLVLCSRL